MMLNATTRMLGLAAAALIALASSATALAERGYHRHHHSGGRVHFGVTLGTPFLYPYPVSAYPAYLYPAYPTTIIVPPAPRIYIEREDVAAAPARSSSAVWYFCRDSDTYYPYVKECASPWERVPARPTLH